MHTEFPNWKPKGKRKLGRPCHRREESIKIDLKEIMLKCGLDSSGSLSYLLSLVLSHMNKSTCFSLF
jgi:hypothetical protein